MNDITIVMGSERHLVCNGSTEAGWLTACGVRSPVGQYAVRMNISEINCKRCNYEMDNNDY